MDVIRCKLASRWKRFGGSFFDGLISIILVVPVMFIPSISNQIKEGRQMSISQTALFFFLSLVAFLIIHGYFLSKYGQTVGKKIMGTRIVSKETGRILPLGSIFMLRVLPISIINEVPGIGSILGLADVLFIFRSDKRCIHDLIAGTVVVDINPISNQCIDPPRETPVAVDKF